MHWILRREETQRDFFAGVRGALKPGGVFVFEMGGMGNVAEVCIFFILLQYTPPDSLDESKPGKANQIMQSSAKQSK